MIIIIIIIIIINKNFYSALSRCDQERLFSECPECKCTTTVLKGATSRFVHLEKFRLNFFELVICNPC